MSLEEKVRKRKLLGEFKTLTQLEREDNFLFKSALSHKYGFEFHDPSFTRIPNLNRYCENFEARKRIYVLEQFLLNTSIINMGTNVHSQMQQIEKEFTPSEYEWFKRHNKLGINCWGPVIGITLNALNYILREELFIVSPKIKEQARGYHSLSFEEKTSYVREIDGEIYSMFERFPKK